MTQKTRPDIAEWLRSLGNVPLSRIVMDPLPGTATERDLLRLVERDKRLVELIDGTLVEKPVGYKESQIAMWLGMALGNFIYPRRLGFLAGEAGTLRMKSGRIRLPDLSFVSIDDVPGGVVPDEPVPELPPTLAIEIVSESNTAAEMRQKVQEYFDSGSRLVWLVYPAAKTVAVYESASAEPTRTLTEADVLDGGRVLPGFSIPVSEIFAPLTRGN
jgi:Uma2 family endonuclease